MSILIMGLKKPEVCDYCPISLPHVAELGCGLDLEHCPIVDVSKHGRLVDADLLERNAQERLLMCNKYDNQFQRPYEVLRAIDEAPTIIEAERDVT